MTASRHRNRAFWLAPGIPIALLTIGGGCAAVSAPSPASHDALGRPSITATWADGAAPASCGPLVPASRCASAPWAAAPDESDAASGDPEEEEMDDGLELPEPEPEAAARRPPLADLTDAQIERMIQQDPALLGSMSVGFAGAGALFNGIPMPEGEQWNRVDPGHAWGTKETIDSLVRCIGVVHGQFAGTPMMHIGHISAKDGGPLSPHVSHQAGRDVDISYFLLAQDRWYQRATARNLDAPRTWAFVKALLTESDVELILIDSSIQQLLKAHARASGEDEAWLDEVFQLGSKHARPIIRHAKGHATHLHVRFYNPVAQEMGRRAYPLLIKHDKIKPPSVYVQHKAKKGETLGSLANKYATTAKAIQAANGLHSTRITAQRTYRIPRAGGIKLPPGPIAVPSRRLPPKSPRPLPGRSSADKARALDDSAPRPLARIEWRRGAPAR